MKKIIIKKFVFVILCLLIPISAIAKTDSRTAAASSGEAATVQSAFGGSMYVRSSEGKDGKGKTQVFKVKNEGDELIDEYPMYMSGELYLGWSPIIGKWCLVQLAEATVTSDIDHKNMGKVERLAFYAGGKEIFSYKYNDLLKLGLKRRVAHLQNHLGGDFMIKGIKQMPNTNNYVFSIEKNAENPAQTAELLLDIVTGKIFVDIPTAK